MAQKDAFALQRIQPMKPRFQGASESATHHTQQAPSDIAGTGSRPSRASMDQGKVAGFALGSVFGAGVVFVLLSPRRMFLGPLFPVSSDQTSRGSSGGVKGADTTFLAWGQSVMEWIVQYRHDCRSRPVISRVAPNQIRDMLPSSAPEKGEAWEVIVKDLDTIIAPGLTNWEASNRFFAYFKPHSSYPAVVGELLSAGINVMGFDWIASPACTELEVVTLDWLARILYLPHKFLHSSPGPGGGVIQGSAGEAAIVVLLAAVSRLQKRAGSLSREKMVVYSSDQTHAIVQKACMILGIGHYRPLPTAAQENWTLQPETLTKAIEEDIAAGLCPVAVVATSGTTSTCAFDPLPEIAAVCSTRGLWLHVDAAYGGAYSCLPELRHLFAGLDRVDSFCVNCHKKLLCPFDLAALYVSDRSDVIQALSVQPEYLKNAASDSGAVIDFEHWQLPLGRRFRSLKLWFVLRHYGAEGVRHHIRQGTVYANHIGQLVQAHPALELACPVSLSLVCFRLKGRTEAQHEVFLEKVKATGECFVIHSKLGGKVIIRFACGGSEQTMEDVEEGWGVLIRVLESLDFA